MSANPEPRDSGVALRAPGMTARYSPSTILATMSRRISAEPPKMATWLRESQLLRSIILPDYFTWAGFLTDGGIDHHSEFLQIMRVA